MLLNNEQREELILSVDNAEETAEFPEGALSIAREAGLLSADIDRATNNEPDQLLSMVQSIYEAGRVSASLGTILSMHFQQVHVIARHGNERLKSHVADCIRTGQNYIGSITTERASGGDLRESHEKLARTSDGTIILDRDAPIVTGGQVCDSFVVKVAEPDGGTSIVYVPRGHAEISVGASSWNPMGMRESASVSMHLRATVPDWFLIGAAGQFDQIVSESFGVFAHIGWASAWLGTATECGNRLSESIRRDSTLRKKLADSDIMLGRLAAARSDLDTVRYSLDALIQDYTCGRSGTSEFAIRTNDLKILASTRCFQAVNSMMEIGGLPLGYMKNPTSRIERAFRDLRSASMNFSNDKLAIANGKLIMRAGFGSPPQSISPSPAAVDAR